MAINSQAKLRIDRWIGLPIAWAGNLAARILGKVLRRDHTMSSANVRVVVLAKFVGMGSIVQAIPLIRAVRNTYPNARVVFLTGAGCRHLCERIDSIDEVLTVDDGSVWGVLVSSVQIAVRLMRARVDVYIDLEVYSAYASIMALVSMARNRIGFFRKSAGHKRGNYTHLVYFNTHRSIRYIYMQLGRLAGCKPIAMDSLSSLTVRPADYAERDALLDSHQLTAGDYLIVNANASDLMLERRWPLPNYVQFIERMRTATRYPIVLIGSKSECPYVQELFDSLSHTSGSRVVNLCGEVGIGGLLALIEGARCVVTNDSGPMHFAWALDRPTVGLFGPAAPAHYGRLKENCLILYHNVYCSPCVHETDQPPCGGDNVCMKRISVDDVVNATINLINETALPGEPNLETVAYLDDIGNVLGRVTREMP